MLTSGEYNAGSYVLFFLKVYVNASTEQRWTKSKSKEQFSHNRKLITNGNRAGQTTSHSLALFNGFLVRSFDLKKRFSVFVSNLTNDSLSVYGD